MKDKRPILYYQPHLKTFARKLRNNSTLGEKLLWNHLKRKQLKGYNFNRQKPIDCYIVDFFCTELMLAIEIDGSSHEGKEQKDAYRQQRLEKLGIHFLRFTETEVRQDTQAVTSAIERWIERKNHKRKPLPPP